MTVVRSLHICCLLTGTLCFTATSERSVHATTLEATLKEQIVLLAIDNQSLPLQDNLCLYLSQPSVRLEPVLRPESEDSAAPDQLAAHFYGTVLHDGGKFRMWYYGAHRAGGRWKVKGQTCYAESEDGIHWRKPKLGQLDLNGSTQNNGIALVGEDTQGVMVILDESDPGPARRYKMVVQYMPRDYPTLKTAFSADGINWTLGNDLPAREFREHSSFFKHNGRYIVCGHTPSNGESGSSRGRQGFAWVSPDFDHWPIEQVDSFLLREPHPARGDRWGQKFDQVHLGVGAASFGHVAVGLYGLWHQIGWGEGGTTCDFGLVVSNDGMHFREPVSGRVYMKSDEAPAPSPPGKQFPTLLCQGNGILNVGDETRIYYGRWRNSEWPLEGDGSNYYADIGLATLPRDRWGALGLVPDASEGAVWSAPIKLPERGCEISLNADGAEAMRVEVSDENFQMLPQFSGTNAGSCEQQNGLHCAVRWPAGKLDDLADRTVCLRVQLKKESAEPKLFAIYVSNHSNATKPED
ncbi:MAG: hypothetical protein WD468_00280 [Pirellulales bacterium]